MSSFFVERYRPRCREEIVGNKQVIDDIFSLAKTKSIPHCIFEGSVGTGKTTTAYVIARQLYGDTFSSNFMELNASDERGIGVVRDTIKEFAKVQPLGADFKIIFLDESDSLTDDAQEALRRIVERYSSVTRFIFSCNKVEKLIEPIRSRCQVFHFSPLSENDIFGRLNQVALAEGLIPESPYEEVDKVDVLLEIAKQANGDMRNALNKLQVMASYGKLSMANLQKENRSDLGFQIITSLEQGRFLEARNVVKKLLLLGYTERDVTNLLYANLFMEQTYKLTVQQKGQIILELSETDHRLTFGVSGGLQLDALLLKIMKSLKVEK